MAAFSRMLRRRSIDPWRGGDAADPRGSGVRDVIASLEGSGVGVVGPPLPLSRLPADVSVDGGPVGPHPRRDGVRAGAGMDADDGEGQAVVCSELGRPLVGERAVCAQGAEGGHDTGVPGNPGCGGGGGVDGTTAGLILDRCSECCVETVSGRNEILD